MSIHAQANASIPTGNDIHASSRIDIFIFHHGLSYFTHYVPYTME